MNAMYELECNVRAMLL